MKSFAKVLVVVILLALAGGGGWYYLRGGQKLVAFKTEAVKRTNVTATIAATGTVEPEETVDIGAQVAGRILSFGKDVNGQQIDYGSVVEAGTVLAKIDDSGYVSALACAQATVDEDKAGIRLAQGNLEQMNAKLDEAQRDWDRAQKLASSEALAQTNYDAYRCAYRTAKANVTVAEASIDQAKATLAQAQATLETAKQNLGYCTIISPAKGVVIDRRVNIGQTVVASLNAPSLFLLAKDLTRLQVWVAVNEADIGNIHPGQKVTFTVDAFPENQWLGQVRKIRPNATMTQNVVTFTVEIATDNSDGKLLPYLTATALFDMDHRDDVLVVPNTALRYVPQSEQVAPEFRPMLAVMGARRGEGGAGDPASNWISTTSRPASQKAQVDSTVWVQKGELLVPITVHAGITDGAVTQVDGPELKEGLEVVIGERHLSVDGQGTKNPLLNR
jgi:HlyD family secretion protein